MERAARAGAAMGMASATNTSNHKTPKESYNKIQEPTKDEYMGYKSSIDWYNDKKKREG